MKKIKTLGSNKGLLGTVDDSIAVSLPRGRIYGWRGVKALPLKFLGFKIKSQFILGFWKEKKTTKIVKSRQTDNFYCVYVIIIFFF